MKLRVAAAAILATGLSGVAAPSAMGATVISDHECIREGGSAHFDGTGFLPNQQVVISLDGRQFATGPTDAVGRVGGTLSNLPRPGRSEQPGALSITQVSNPAITATKALTETQVYVVAKPTVLIPNRRGKVLFNPARPFRIRAGGFYGAPTLFAHVRGRKKRNLRIGRVTGECGGVALTRKAFFKRRDPLGVYIVQFDTARRFLGPRTPVGGPCDTDTTGGAPFCLKAFRKGVIRLSRSSSFSSPLLGSQARWKPDKAFDPLG